MELRLLSQNVSKLSKQIAVIQQYILLKFGSDFKEFCKTRSCPQCRIVSEPQSINVAEMEAHCDSDSSTPTKRKRNKRKRGVPTAGPVIGPADFSKQDDETNEQEFFENPFDSDIEALTHIAEERIKIELYDNDLTDFNEDTFDPEGPIPFSAQVIPDANDSDSEENSAATDPDYVLEQGSSNASNSNRLATDGKTAKKQKVPNNITQLEGEIEVIESNLGNNKILYGGFKYTLHKKAYSGAKMYWVCCKKSNKKINCPSRMHTTSDMKLVCHIGTHNHEPDPNRCEMEKKLSELKKLSRTSSESPSEIINALQLPEDFQKNVAKLEGLRQMIRRARGKKLTSQPVGHQM